MKIINYKLKILSTFIFIILIIVNLISPISAKSIIQPENRNKKYANNGKLRAIPITVVGLIRNPIKNDDELIFQAIFVYNLCLDYQYRGFYQGEIIIEGFNGIITPFFICGKYYEFSGGW